MRRIANRETPSRKRLPRQPTKGRFPEPVHICRVGEQAHHSHRRTAPVSALVAMAA